MARLKPCPDEARRGWIEKGEVLNTLPVEKMLKGLRQAE